MRSPLIGIVDLRCGNLRSVEKAVKHEGGTPVTARHVDPDWDALILPGVGAFGHAMKSAASIAAELRAFAEGGKPFLGICLGLQILFESSEENPGVPGLNMMKGRVVRIEGRKVPHMGWNSLEIWKESDILEGIEPGDYFYFVHSYGASPEEDVTIATCEYEGQRLTAVVERDNVHACQFHPEKSGKVGLRIIGNFMNMARGS